MNPFTACSRPAQRRFVAVLFAWSLTFVGASFLARTGRLPDGLAGLAVMAVPAVVALLAVLAYGRYLRQADELQRAIELQALALAVGAGFVTWSSFQVLEHAEVAREAWPDVPVLVMCGAYAFGIVLGRRRYA